MGFQQEELFVLFSNSLDDRSLLKSNSHSYAITLHSGFSIIGPLVALIKEHNAYI